MARGWGRLWRSGARRAEVVNDPELAVPDPPDREEIGRRIEEARERLRQTIPPPEDPDAEDEP